MRSIVARLDSLKLIAPVLLLFGVIVSIGYLCFEIGAKTASASIDVSNLKHELEEKIRHEMERSLADMEKSAKERAVLSDKVDDANDKADEAKQQAHAAKKVADRALSKAPSATSLSQVLRNTTIPIQIVPGPSPSPSPTAMPDTNPKHSFFGW